nr:hypothetical protein [Haliscomenobacter sp.]
MNWLGTIALSDEIRPESADAIKTLAENNIKSILLTGDNAKWPKLWVKLWVWTVLWQKYCRIKNWKNQGTKSQGEFVAMTGDGVKRCPSLSSSKRGYCRRFRQRHCRRNRGDHSGK